MSDPAGPLRATLEPYLRSNAGIIAAFGSKPVKVYKDIPPPNAAFPYVFIARITVDDDTSECLDATQVDLQLDVWSLTDPPGFAEAETIAAAVKAAALATADDGNSPPPLVISGYRIVTTQALSTEYLTDPSDGKTVHAFVRLVLAIDPT